LPDCLACCLAVNRQHILEQPDTQAIMNAKQISESLGYDNTSYFIKLFKAFSGYSPKDYRVQK
jgi:YesN/AraC family two-component response regulator